MHRSVTETRDYYQLKLGEDFGRDYYYAFSEYCDVWLTWKQYCGLFQHSPERVQLLNKAGSAFFARVQRNFFEFVILGICRITDPAESGKGPKKQNLTIRRFDQFLEVPEHREKFSNLIEIATAETAFARDWRNRHISHCDYQVLTGDSILKEATGVKIKCALRAIFNVFLFVDNEIIRGNLDDDVIDDLDNELVLLKRIYLGVQAFEESLRDGRGVCSTFPEWL
jgi:AbiU2